jgi:AraC family transcriptional regulator
MHQTNGLISETSGSTVAIGGLRCSLSVRSYSGTDENELESSRHHFAYIREVRDGNRVAIHGSFDGERSVARTLSEQDAFFLPTGRRWAGKTRGSATLRILFCDFEHSVFTDAFGDRAAGVALEPRFGARLIAPGIIERLAALCVAPDAYPRSYGDALAVVFTCELLRACAAKPLSPPSFANAGKARFRPVLDHIEDTLEIDTTLSDLAALSGLSISHFSHAFNATYGIAPHRYILRRRIAKAKLLLGASDATIAAISSRVGFSSQSRFTQIFSRHTGLTPSAYRLKLQR